MIYPEYSFRRNSARLCPMRGRRFAASKGKYCRKSPKYTGCVKKLGFYSQNFM